MIIAFCLVHFFNQKKNTMKFFIFALILTLSFIGCQAVDKWTQFDMQYNAQVTFSSSAGINLPFNLFTPDITSNSEQQFAVNETRKDLIEEIYLKELELTISSPSGEDFSFLEEVSVYISATGLPEIEIAAKKPVPNSTGVLLSLDVSQVDIKEYIKKDKFTLRLKTVMDEILATDHVINVKSVFFVDAEILGV
jgi:hypothetical protein